VKILLTGGTGFIGRNLAVKLSQKGYTVRCLVRDIGRAAWMENYAGLQPVKADLEHKRSIFSHLTDIEAVLHLAGATKAKNKDDYFRINGVATANLLDAVLMQGTTVKKVLYVSSLAVAGPHTSQQPALENEPAAPITYYGESKLLGEHLLRQKCKGISWTIIRPAAVYGPFDKDVFLFFKLAHSGIVPVLGDARMELSMIHVDDVTEGIILAAFAEESEGEIYYLSDGRVHYLENILKLLKEITGGGKVIRVPPIVGRIAGFIGDCSAYISGKPQVINSQKVKEALQKGWVCNTKKIGGQLGFTPAVQLEAGFEATYNWYKTAGWL
jgi:nucleoside-diphosphate-sugar epimerase